MLNGGALLGNPIIHYGKVVLEETRLGDNCFLGNNALVTSGSILENDTLLGVFSVAPQLMQEGSTYLGSPPFKLAERKKWAPETLGASDLRYNPPCWALTARFFMNILKVIIAPTIQLTLYSCFVVIIDLVLEMDDIPLNGKIQHFSLPVFLYLSLLEMAYILVLTYHNFGHASYTYIVY